MNANGAAALSLTRRQREVMWMRYERGASIEQIADWLKLTRRAVLYRLQGAKQRFEAAREWAGVGSKRKCAATGSPEAAHL